MMGRLEAVLLLGVIALMASSSGVEACWTENGVVICAETGNQINQTIVSDGVGGAIIAWEDYRTGIADIYANRVDPNGVLLWSIHGVPLCTASERQAYPQSIPVGSGGCIVTWEDQRSGTYDIYAQKVNSDGSVAWTTNGVAICTASGDQQSLSLASDGAGGAIITWEDYRSGSNYDIYAQRVNANGSVAWTTNGVPVCTASNSQTRPQIISNGSGVSIIVWDDFRGSSRRIYAQKVDPSGQMLWAADGAAVCSAAGDHRSPLLVADGSDGAIVIWSRYPTTSSTSPRVYAQRIDAAGSRQWDYAGVQLCSATGNQNYPQLVSDGSGGAIVTWWDTRDYYTAAYAQRVSIDGQIMWPESGVRLITNMNISSSWPQLISDEAGGAILTWSGVGIIGAQRLDASGTRLWGNEGVHVRDLVFTCSDPCLTSDGLGGAILAWEDRRQEDNDDIYAQQIDAQGRTGYPPTYILSVKDAPADQGGSVNLSWIEKSCTINGLAVTHYTIWRALSAAQAQLLLMDGAVLLSDSEGFRTRTEGRPFIRQASIGGLEYYWERVDSLGATHEEVYTRNVPTAFDSSAICTEYHYFQVVAHTADPNEYYVSDPDSGRSVDNLAPAEPIGLEGERGYEPAGLTLRWLRNTEQDLYHYALYRGMSDDFTPSPTNLIASTFDSTYFDPDWCWGSFYKVSAIDIHRNESTYALLRPDMISGSDNPGSPQATYLAQNFPNPFNPMTRIEFGLREPARISLRIFDAGGRLVRVLAEDSRPAGRYTAVWDGHDGSGNRVASGMYFYRLSAGAFVETKKLVLLR